VEKGPHPTAGHAPACRVRRGHAQQDQHGRSAPGFIATEIGAHFEFRPNWYRDEAVRGAVLSYYGQMRLLLHERPDLRACLKRCRQCRIFFFTDPRNAGRDDLRCGFGCREAHRRRESHRRSAHFYNSHPEKKRHQNRRRYLNSAGVHQPAALETERETPPPIVCHVCVIVSLVERRAVGLDEILELLAKKGRQHRMVRRRRGTYGRRRIEGRGS
jgi:hypothetical protein